ncbi:MAG: LysM peptidoglycan-binding domain-containing protein [Bacillota bacterium]|nr:LysM peptidoglycan-binding domain-containing protein [Bacillota bacterium]
MDYRIYLTFNNEQEVIELPVLPEKIEIRRDGSNKTYDLLNTGEINVIRGLRLPELAIESYFPTDGIHVTSEALFEPVYYVGKILKWAGTCRPIRLTMTGAIELSWPVSIESFTYSESGGAVGEISYRLELKKYIFYGPATVTDVNGNMEAKKARETSFTVPETVTLRQNEDTFWIIAKKYLGSGNKAAALARLNNMSAGTVLFAGQTIRLR